MSHTNSMASSQRHILADHQGMNMALEPPVAPFASQTAPGSPTASQRSSAAPFSTSDGSTTNALSVNFVPSKFSRPILPGGIYKRKVKSGKGVSGLALPKQGGGREAFKSGEARMPGEKDEDYDGVDVSRRTLKSKLRWNRFKCILFCANLVVSLPSPHLHFIANIFSIVLCILPSRAHLLPPHLVQRLDTRRRRPRREPHRAHPLHDCRLRRRTHLHPRLVRNPTQQPQLPRMLHASPLGHLRAHCRAGVRHLQDAHLQPRGQDQRAVKPRARH